jgi:diadenosine tetraphosphate (Ap4A) HIT family hydrolase
VIGSGDADQDLVVLRTGDVFVIPTLKQRVANHGQVIVLPVAHVTALHEAGPALRTELFDVVATLTATMPGAFGATGSTVVQHNHPTGESHLHVHVVPRFSEDDFVMPDPAIETAPRPLRTELAVRLRQALARA